MANDIEFGVLFSHASDIVTPGLVEGPFTSATEAVDFAQRVLKAQPGITAVLAVRPVGGAWTVEGVDVRTYLTQWQSAAQEPSPAP